MHCWRLSAFRPISRKVHLIEVGVARLSQEHCPRLVPAQGATTIFFCGAGGSNWPTCMVRPCVARGFRRSVGSSVLHQCIRPLIGACAPGHHGYQRACVLITGQASSGPFGSPVFAYAGKTGPPSLLILSQTSAENRIRCYVIACFLGPVPLFVPGGRSSVPACH